MAARFRPQIRDHDSHRQESPASPESTAAWTAAGATVLLLDGEPRVRGGLARLLAEQGYMVRPYETSTALLDAGCPPCPACLLLDQVLGDGWTGLQVQQEIIRRGWNLPIVFLAGQWDVQTIVDAVRAGADAFMTKPYDPLELLGHVAAALERSSDGHASELEIALVRERVGLLTPREREIVCLVVAGRLNKEISALLGISVATVKIHRCRAMRKLQAKNPASLAKIASLVEITPQG